jgi:hypothetical protein
MPIETIRSALQKHSRSLLSVPGVVGFAEGESAGKPCIRVFVTEKSDLILRNIPGTLEGYAVIIEETGKFKALK